MTKEQAEKFDDMENLSTPASDRFADALDLCRLAWDTQRTKARLIKLRAAKAELAAVKAEAVEIRAKAESDAKAIRDEAQQRLEAADARLEAAATAEEELAQREQKNARREAAWRNLGEPQDVLSGLRSPEFSPLQKARMAHGQPPGKNPDRLFSAEPDAAPAMRIDALSDTSDDPHADRQGVPFVGGELTRDVTHKRKSAA